MGWLRDKIFNDEKKCFLLIGIIGTLEMLNLEFLSDMPYGISIITSIIFFAITTYLIGMQYMTLKDRYKSFLHKNHLDIVTKLESVAQELSKTEDRLSNQATDHYKDVVENLKTLDEKLNKSVSLATETICATLESSQKNVVLVLNKNKEEVLEDARNNADAVKKDILQHLQDTSKQVNHVKERIVEEVQHRSQQLQVELGQIEKAISERIQSEGNQNGLLIGEVKDRLTSSLNELKEQNIMSTDNILDQSNQMEKAVIGSMKSEGTQIGVLIDRVRDQLASTLGELKDQSAKSAEEIIDKASRMEEIVITCVKSESNQAGILIADVREQLTSSLDNLKEHNEKSTKDILGKTNQTEETVISLLKLEGNQIGTIIGEVREQMASALDEIKEQNTKSTEEILSKTSQDYISTANGINEGFEKVDKEIKGQTQLVIDGITSRFDSISSLVQETIDQLQIIKVSSKAELDSFIEGIETKWNDVSYKMESFDVNNENRFNRTKEMFDSAIDSMKVHTDQGTHYTTTRLIETIEHVSEQNLSKVSTTIIDGNKLIGQTLEEMENHVLEKMEWMNLEQAELKTFISEAIQTEKENKENVLKQVNHLSETFTSLQNKAFQNVLDQLSSFKVEQLDTQRDNKDQTERQYNHVNQQITGLTKNLLLLEENMKKTILQFESWKNEQLQKGDRIFAMLSKVHDLDSNLAQAAKHLFDQHETFGQKVDVLSSQINSINALIKALKSNSGKGDVNPKNISIEETQKGKSRIEKINDDENGILIVNKYEHEVLSNSEMYQNGKKVYLAEYDRKGNMISSKNFDQSGKVMTEMTYFPNGAIKERKENVKRNGKVVTQISEFNQNGLKIK